MPNCGKHLIVSLLAMLLLCGCGKYKTHPLHGRVTLKDGTPLDAVCLTFESTDRTPPISAASKTDENGNYSVGTVGVDDGIPAGVYQLSVSEPGRIPSDPRPGRIDMKYARRKTSGLKFEVPIQNNTLDLQLDPRH